MRIWTRRIVIRSWFLYVEISKVENSNQLGGVLIMSVINQIYKNKGVSKRSTVNQTK